MLEVSGRYHEIFVPEMTVAQPFFRQATPAGMIEFDGEEAVKGFYLSLSDAEATVMLLDHEVLSVSDWGFGSEALYNIYMTGATAAAHGHEFISLEDARATFDPLVASATLTEL